MTGFYLDVGKEGPRYLCKPIRQPTIVEASCLHYQSIGKKLYLKEASPIKEGEDLPPRKCPDCGGLKWIQINKKNPAAARLFCKRCGPDGFEHYTAGSVTLVRARDVLVEPSDLQYRAMTDWICDNRIHGPDHLAQTTPIPSEAKK